MVRVLPLLLVLAACNRNLEDDSAGGEDIDNTPLAFNIESPEDDVFTLEASVTVTGTVDGPDDYFAMLNGADLVESDGTFSMGSEATLRPWGDSPIWPVLGHAEDPSGYWLRDRVTLLAGESADASAKMLDAMAFRLTDILLVELRPVLEEQIDALDLAAQITSSTIPRFEYSDVALTTLDFTPAGLSYEITVYDVDADVDSSWYSGNVTADSIALGGDIVFGVDAAGAITATAGPVSVSFSNMLFDGSPNGFYEGILNAAIGPALGPTIGDQLTGALDQVLSFQDSIRELDFGGVIIHTDFTAALHDQDGVTIHGDSTISTDAGPLAGLRLSNPNVRVDEIGAVTRGGVAYDAALYLDDDLISGLGVGLKAQGLLEQEISGTIGGLSLNTTLMSTFVEAFEQLPEGQPMTIKTRPTTVPCGAPSPGAPEAAMLHIGGLALEFYADADEDGADDLVMTTLLDTVLGLRGGADLIEVDIDKSQATVISSILEVGDPTQTETALAGVLDIVLPSVVSGALGGVALDGIEVIDSRPAGPAGDRAGLYLDLDVALLIDGGLPL